MSKRIVGYFTLPLLLLLAMPPRDGWALSPPEGFAPGPDVIMGNLPSLIQAGSNGTQVGLMMGTDICNNGDVQVNWFHLPETDHPVIPQNLYRLSGGANNDDRFEQIGQSWAMHQFFPLQQNACGFGCISAPDSAHLGVGCSTSDTANLNGSQQAVGSRAWVNPFTGIFPATANTHTGHTHDGTTHRILVEGNDLSPAMNPGATYYGEAQLVTPHEYAWCQSHAGECNMFNNVSYRQFAVTGTTNFNFAPVGATVRMTPAIFAWPGATIQAIEPEPGVDGRAYIAYKVTCQVGLPTTCDYEYAIYNENLDRGIQSFSVPGGCGFGTPTNLEFHAPLNHPGIADDGTAGNAGYSNAPWAASGGPAAASWHTETFAQNPNANALRWGTLHNFRFRSGTGPRLAKATIGFFKTGAPMTVVVVGPNDECQPSPSPSATAPPTATPTATQFTPPPTPTATASPGTCGWSFATPLSAPILAKAVTSLGGNLYAFGGSYNSVRFAISHKFNRAVWTTIAPLPVALSGAAAVTDGTSIYILGGADSSGTAVNTLYKYDPVANSYTTLMPFGTASAFHAAVYLNGKIYKFGGATNALEIYNIATNQWTIGANYPLSASYLGGFAHGNFIYGAGGFVSSPPAPTSKTFSYDPVSNTWSDAAIADLPATIQGAAAVSSNGGGVLVGGRVGGSISTSVISWEQATNVWSSLPSMLAARSNMNGAVLNGDLYVVGGGSVASPGGTKEVQRFGCGPAPSPTPTATATASPSSTIIIDPGSPTPTATATASPTPTPTPPCGLLLGENFDNVIPPALPPGWSSASWVTSTIDPETAPNCASVDAPAFLSDRDMRSILVRPLIPLASISFRNNYNLESSGGEFFDGAVLEISSPNINGGAFTDITHPSAGGSFISGGYNGTISTDFGSPIAGREAWSGNSGGYINTAVYFGASVTGRTVELRFRMASDLGGSGTGRWRIDTIVFDGVCQVLTPTPTPTPSASATPSPTASATVTPPATPSPTGTPTPSPSPTTKALNLSTRMLVGPDDHVGIGGFIIAGTAPKHVLIRGIGPSLTGFGIPNALANPVLELHGPTGFTTVTNNDWRDTQEAEIQATGIPPTNNLESAIVAHLPPGNYTAIVRGGGNTSGVALVEVYDLNQGVDARLANISTRAFVLTGDNIVIAGFTLGGHTNNGRIILRGLGPSMTAFGIPNPVADPTLELRDSNGTLLIANNDWEDNPDQAGEINAAGLAPSNELEAAIAGTLAPGPYTALLAGRNNGTGLGLVEIYDVGNVNVNPTPSPTPGGSPSPVPSPTPSAVSSTTPGGTSSPFPSATATAGSSATPVATPSGTPNPSPTPTPCGGPTVTTFDSVTAPALPAGWVAANNMGNATMWVTTTTDPDTAPNAAFLPDEDGISDKTLDSPNVLITSPFAQLSFRNHFNTEADPPPIGVYWDGGVLEISINGGAFKDILDPAIGGAFLAGPYTGEIESTSGNPLAGRLAWSGDSGGYIDTMVRLGANVSGQTIKVRFRMGTDESVSAPGWWIDTLTIEGCPVPLPSPTPSPTPSPGITPSPTPTGTPTPTPTPSCPWSFGPPFPADGLVRAPGNYFPANGRFYVIGGRSADVAGSDFTHPFEYNPATNAWTIKPSTIPDLKVNNMACAVLTVGGTPQIYCVGGNQSQVVGTTGRVFSYNPATDTFTTLAAGDDWPGNQAGAFLPGGFAVLANKFYTIGSFNANSVPPVATNQVWRFDPTAAVGSKWVAAQNYPVARCYLPAASLGGLIYTGGGTAVDPTGLLLDSAESFKYDPVTNIWSTIANIPRATGETRAVVMGDKIAVLGGGRTVPNPSNEVDVYDPITNNWSVFPHFTIARRNFAVDNDGSGRLWMVGGYDSTGNVLNSMEIFGPPTCP